MPNRYAYTEEELALARQTTSGFYRKQDNQLQFGRFYVLHQDYELHRHLKDTYQYPVDGWSWYESEEAARLALELPAPVDPEQQIADLLAGLDDHQRELLLKQLVPSPKLD